MTQEAIIQKMRERDQQLREDAEYVEQFAARLDRLVMAQDSPDVSRDTREIVQHALGALELVTCRRLQFPDQRQRARDFWETYRAGRSWR